MPDVVTLLPASASQFECNVEQVMSRLGDVSTPIRPLWRPAAAPADVLPWLAWALSVDNWDPAWTEDVKRAAIRSSIAVHRRKGTREAVRQALEALALDLIVIREWWEPDGPPDPYTFDIEVGVNTRGLEDGEWALISDVIARTKNVRSHLNQLRVYLHQRSAVPKVAAALLSGETTTVYPYSVTELLVDSPTPKVGGAMYGVETCTIYPLT